jgi:hypothetical protein
MTDLPLWEYSGSVVLTEDMSLLESGLHAGRVAAAERGYQAAPESIEVHEVMLSPDGETLVSEAEAGGGDGNFAPTHLRFLMTWNAEDGDSPARPEPK